MKSIKLSFTCATTGNSWLNSFWFLVIALIILDDDDRREKERRKKRNRQAQPPRKPSSGPKPYLYEFLSR